MGKTICEARAFMDALAATELPDGVQPFVLPAHTSLATARDRLPRDTSILLGAQNAHWAPEGGCTGEISMRMAADAGARLIEMGHSERRAMFGETDEIVARKARAAVDHGLIPLICVGEPGSVRAAGQAESYVAAQLSAALSRLSDQEVGRVLVAYEPVWAIGRAGRPATPSEIAPVMSTLAWLLDGLSRGSGCRALLYGGGVHQGNAAELLRAPCTDGLFVGRAAWNVEGFLALLAIGEEHHAFRHGLRGVRRPS